MKRVHFDDMKDWKALLLMICSLILMLLGFFKPFDFETPNVYKTMSIIGFLIIAIYLSKMFWYKNYVQWNKKGMNIKIKSFAGKSISFNEVKATKLEDGILTITKKDRTEIEIDISEIELDDANKLNEIIVKNYSLHGL